MKINGKETAFEPHDSLAVILEKNGFSLTKIAVMQNDHIAEYDKTFVKADDTIEVVSFVGGG